MKKKLNDFFYLCKTTLKSCGVFQSHAEVGSSPEVCVTQVGGTLGRTRSRPRDVSYSTFATMRRDHIIADAIPGPESCV
jgi:hypothetical protein